MISKPALDCKDAVVVGYPEYAGSTTIIPASQPDMTNAGTDLNVAASSENLSAHWKNGAQDVPAAGQHQYE